MDNRYQYSGHLVATLAVALGLVATGCTFDSAGIPSPEECGNGVVVGGEECDTSDLAGASCGSLGYGTGTLACASNCTFDTSGCSSAPVCGDGTVDTGEECDDGNNEDCDGCSASCLSEGCGNGTVECDEECDDGNNEDCDGCSASCTGEGCGNGTVECDELCEAGQVSSTCAAEGYINGTLGCNPTCDGYDTSLCLRNDGQDCTGNSQCVGNICYTETLSGYPAGQCTSDCTSLPCLNGGVCLEILPNGSSRCYQPCTDSTSCRPGYYCRIDPFEDSELVCRPLCTSSSDCPDTGICNNYEGRCNSVISVTAGDNGAACGGWTDCKGGCLMSPPGGYCVSECNTSNPICPGDGVCSAIKGSDVGDLGYCLDGCLNSSDCVRTGYNCESNPAGSGGDVCWSN